MATKKRRNKSDQGGSNGRATGGAVHPWSMEGIDGPHQGASAAQERPTTTFGVHGERVSQSPHDLFANERRAAPGDRMTGWRRKRASVFVFFGVAMRVDFDDD